MSGEYNFFDDVFTTEEQDIGTFMDVIQDQVADHGPNEMERIRDCNPDTVAQPVLSMMKSNGLSINHGPHAEDYVWHIGPEHHKKVWKVSTDRVVYAVAKIMNSIVPEDIEVKIWLPHTDWDIPEITFKAIGLRDCWNVDQKAIDKLNLDLMKGLTALL